MGRDLFFGILLSALSALPAAAQAIPDSVRADTVPRESNAPRNAFIKSLLVPGLGQFSIGEPVRGSVWVAVRGSSYFMLVKTLNKLAEAKDRHGNYRAQVRAILLDSVARDTTYERLVAEDPLRLETDVARDPLVAGAQALVESRTRHRQDWITYTLFFTFLDGLDAYVATHLRNFPANIDTDVQPDGRMSMRVDVPLPRRRHP